MDKETRSAIERATQRARRLLEEDFAAQLEGEFDVQRSGGVAVSAGSHLAPRRAAQRERIVASIEHKRAAGMSAAGAVADYLRDAAFTTLNRFVALKMLEARELVQECISKGEDSGGYREFCGLASGLPLLPDSAGYRIYIESLFDELSTEIKVLFDRRDPASALWPRRTTFEALLALLNSAELANVWGEDETIGWVYQYFNGGDERRKMREESQAPRNSRELAIRNQFFTPRYVVQFLTDNTLGRIWYEMRRGETSLARSCEYLVRRPKELFRSDPTNLDDPPEWVPKALDGRFEAIPEDLRFSISLELAHAIDGYASANARDIGKQGICGAESIALAFRDEFEHSGSVQGHAADLWISLFYEARADRHAGGYGADSPYGTALCQALRRALVEKRDPSARAVLVPFRAKKDPRDLRVLDPACGSGHFLLYAFDLLTTIYEESWADSDLSNPPSETTGRTLRADYSSVDALRKAIPGLLLANNVHGVDIDPRCAQIAQLALWMRAQKAYRDFGIGRAERPQIRRSNIVVAEPLVADGQIATEFVAKLDDVELGRLFIGLVEALRHAGDLGLLLRVEELVRPWKSGRSGDLFAPPEERIRAALDQFVSDETSRRSTRRRLFADDAAHGVALLGVAEKKFDTVLMNPPFGEMPQQIQNYADAHYPEGRNDIYAVFVRRASELAARANGCVGAITSRAFVTGRDHRHFRRSLLAGPGQKLSLFADLGAGVLDGAMVETAAYVLGPPKPAGDDDTIEFLDARDCERSALAAHLQRLPHLEWPSARFLHLPQADLVYDLDDEAYRSLTNGGATFEPAIGRVTFGLTTKDDFRFVRLRWEIPPNLVGRERPWSPFAKGGEYSWFTATTHLLVRQGRGAEEIAAFAEQRDGNIASTRRSSAYYFNAAVCFSRRSQRGFSARRLRPNACFSDKTAVIVPQLGQERWLNALAPVLASVEYQRLIAAQSKFGSYEIGPVKALPVPDERALAQDANWKRLYDYFDVLESVDETSETFAGLPPFDWSPSRAWHHARVSLVDGLAACGLTASPEILRQLDTWVEERESRYDADRARRSWAVGVVFGRFLPGAAYAPEHAAAAHFGAPHAVPPACQEGTRGHDVLVDDYGHRDDIAERLHAVVADASADELREWVRSKYWLEHLNAYSRSRRAAPIYWQLATPSASYSVWLYIHAFTKDTLFRVQNEYVAPKLAHEERRLELLASELRDGGTAAQRKELAAQESFLEELRAFHDEVKRVAPLWKPNLDDGVIINFAPLWRLVPQHRGWQKEARAIWDALCEGKYDWSHLAMHLWPERVVPKCATDRSLAIAHGVEEVFWLEGSDGKWTGRKLPTKNVDELVQERTSPAVRSALKSLLEAPVAMGKGVRKGGGRRDDSAAATPPDSAVAGTGTWARPRTHERGEIQAAILAVLKVSGAPMDRRQVRLASLLCLEPHLLTPMLDKTDKAEWVRAIGGDATRTAGAPIDTLAREWGAALVGLRGRGRLLENLQQGTWALGADVGAIVTKGWPEGRAAFVVNVLRHLQAPTQIDAIILRLPTAAQQWVADAA